MIQPRHSGMFKPGQSGNPLGRPKMDQNVRELAKAESIDAIKELSSIMRDGNAPYMARIQACNSILDRAWGKPVQHTESANLSLSIDDFLTMPEQGNPFAP